MNSISFRIQSQQLVDSPWILNEKIPRRIDNLRHQGAGRYSFSVLTSKNENTNQILGDLVVQLLEVVEEITYLEGKFNDTYVYSQGRLLKNGQVFAGRFV
jgi:hypothetical protein